jgi:hypothetical protein
MCMFERGASVIGVERPLERVDVVQWVWMMPAIFSSFRDEINGSLMISLSSFRQKVPRHSGM